MPANKLALIRYQAIDQCLQNRYKKWTLDDLVQACSEAVYEYEGIRGGVSKRTVQLDIQNMRSSKFGYEAPIIVLDKKYYTYENPQYSIRNVPVSKHDLQILSEAVGLLKQFKNFGYYEDLGNLVSKLEAKISKKQNEGRSFIDLEKNEQVKGLQWLDVLHKAILQQSVLQVDYKSFKARNTENLNFSPYLLKEYRNRWFLLGSTSKNAVRLLALDRIQDVKEMPAATYIAPTKLDVQTFFDDVIGVTKAVGQQPILITLWADAASTPYLLTKPLHSSQQVTTTNPDGSVQLQIRVVWNFELEREILGFGETMRVISPPLLAKKIRKRTQQMLQQYLQENEPKH
ncbi:Predicted DNA-binding transcriptional regulator YafY, contains an HTH and WYL domains [Flexibacter flexilis DSM 6793]|uniref:Predicted DNA-binding transcriptional regulator YafY, contains an HTH and WYL domains n=1 Tax=Flexibacter flexilis DSM 6793 TaxID=927664 RepID=A0A1I1G4J3_9BACT|nr:WYL domain-containing protein [Flexibacter flexilis]SFC06667.1 Predicted DNA-binding transcriptional regulator YafY, contains an HTH and WYL domains [Flexibacter flexilis DSM 6793]